MDNKYYPNGWQFIKIQNGSETVVKLFASWLGGFTQAEHWRLNSGCTLIEEDENTWVVHGYSGSTYHLQKEMEGELDLWNDTQLKNIIDMYKYNFPIEKISTSEAITLVNLNLGE